MWKIPFDTLCEQHQEIINKSVRYITRVIFLAFSFSLTYTMRTTIFTSYCYTFNDHGSDTVISIVLFSSYISSGCMSLIFGEIADRWRFDHLLIIATILDVITFWIEATTRNFTIFAIVYAISGQPIQSLVYGMFNRLLPIYHAQHISVLYGLLKITGNIMGPLLGGIISYYTDEYYRGVFYTSASFATVLCIYSLLVISSKQKLIEDEQLVIIRNCYSRFAITNTSSDTEIPLSRLDEKQKWLKSENYRFPLAKIVGHDDYYNQNMHALDELHGENNKYTTAEITNILLLVIMGGLIRGCEAGFVAYYILYLKRDIVNLNTSTIVVIGELQIAITGLFLVIGSLLVKKLLKKHKFSWIDVGNNIYTKLTVFALIQGLCTFCLLPFSNNFEILSQITSGWIGMPFVGFSVGCSYLCINIIIIQILPKRASGIIAGVRVTGYNFFQAITVLCIGILMQLYIQWFWFMQAINYLLTLILLFVFVFVNVRIFKH